ncbi:MAG: hypothetical protein CR997_00620 [Acidobacteria bacterium]|nr:MAG: hypothetical protein CR997_00620 [Acidobacteriota bacterium]
MSLLSIQNLWKSFQSGPKTLRVLKGVSFNCQKGELLAVMGPSGCGKTTLLNLISGLDTSDKGRIVFNGVDLVPNKDTEWDQFRCENLGMVFQFNQLLPEFTAMENVALPALIRDRKRSIGDRDVQERAENLLSSLGLSERTHHRPAQLSGGEQQRVAIARALINSPSLLLADEPTGSLDQESGLRVFEMLRQLQQEMGFACLVVTHNRELAAMCDRIIALENETS